MSKVNKHFMRGAHTVVAIPVLTDNFVYLVRRGSDAVVIDAGAMLPVAGCLEEQGWRLRAIYLTHAHADHVAGYDSLRARLEPLDTGLFDPQVMDLPGHTAADKGYYFAAAGVVFTGDCLINGACGRVFGGTMREMFDSLQQIKALPADTLVLGGHDYLLDNLRFGALCEPENAAIQKRMARYQQDPAGAVFVTLAEEMASNPFLRAPNLSAFRALREAKDRFG